MKFEVKFIQGHSYQDFLNIYATPDQKRQWTEVHDRVNLAETQTKLLVGFVRDMNVLCLAGAWCGDCAAQCPIFDRFARSCEKLHLRFVDRDSDKELAEELRICGGHRVPVVVFLSEDFAECARYGDRTLGEYRRLASEQLNDYEGAKPIHPSRRDAAPRVQEWLHEFERVQLMLRLSPRLRRMHND